VFVASWKFFNCVFAHFSTSKQQRGFSNQRKYCTTCFPTKQIFLMLDFSVINGTFFRWPKKIVNSVMMSENIGWWHGRRSRGGLGRPGFWNFQQKRCFISFKWENTNFTTFAPPGKIWKQTQCPPWKNPSDAHGWRMLSQQALIILWHKWPTCLTEKKLNALIFFPYWTQVLPWRSSAPKGIGRKRWICFEGRLEFMAL